MDKIVGEGWLEQDRWDRTTGRDSQDKTAGTGQPEKTVRTVHAGQETEDKTARIGQLGQEEGIGHR